MKNGIKRGVAISAVCVAPLIVSAGGWLGSNTCVVAYGDSITRGYAVAQGEGWVELLAGALNQAGGAKAVPVWNAGGNGNTSAEGLRRIDRDVLAHMPGLVLVEFGGNDPVHDDKRQVSVAAFKSNLETICGKVREKGGTVVLVTFPPVIDEWHSTFKDPYFRKLGGLDRCLEPYRKTTRELAGTLGCPLFDLDKLLRAELKKKRPELLINRDGIHLTPAANKLVFEAVIKFIR